jgi:pyrroloquinoline quinone biosynthesis protein D
MSARLDQRPLLSRAARLRFEAQTDSYVLLSPERGLRLNATATEVVQRCTGKLTVQEIIGELIETWAAEPAVSSARVTEDVLDLLLSLSQRRLVRFEPHR